MRSFLRFSALCLFLLIPFFACMDFGSDEGNGCDGPYEIDLGGGAAPNPCRGVVCPDDGDPCTLEYCSGGSCRTRPAENGTPCAYDGLAGVCVAGVCGENLCADVVCDEPCSEGVCDFVDGLCDYTPMLPDGAPCVFNGSDGVCVGGICGENLCDGVFCDEEPCSEGVCSYVDGSCSYTGNQPDGTPCVFDGNDGVCVDGVCGEDLCKDADCDDGDACTDGTCDYRDGLCDFTPVVCADDEQCTTDTCAPEVGCVFTPSEDGTACGTSGMCEGGACVEPCDRASDEEYPCPITGSEDLFCCPGYPDCRGSCVEYTHDFESLDRRSPTALETDGWQIYGQVRSANGAVKFGYGPFPAPNGGAGFSAIVTGEGGPDQGAQQLSVYNDYNCCQPAQGHFNGTDRVESSVFQQRPISADEVGKIFQFSFDVKRGNINDPTGNSTALAFIQTFDLDAGYAQTNSVTVNTTNAGTAWERYSISLAIGPDLAGQLLEFGFLSIASDFEPSGVLYDNVQAVFETP